MYKRNSILSLLAFLAALFMTATPLVAHAQQGECNAQRSKIWTGMNEMIGVVPGVGQFTKAFLAMSKTARAARCTKDGIDQLTMAELRQEIEAQSKIVVDEELREIIENLLENLVNNTTATLPNFMKDPNDPLALIELSEAEMEAYLNQMSIADRDELADHLETIADSGTFIQTAAATRTWPILPTFTMLTSMEIGLWKMAYQLYEYEGSEHQLAMDRLSNKIALQELITREGLINIEKNFIDTYPKVTFNYSDYGSDWYINWTVTSGDEINGEGHWQCHHVTPRSCQIFNTRVQQMRATAKNTWQELVESRNQTLDVSYLRFKNEFDFSNGMDYQFKQGGMDLGSEICTNTDANGVTSVVTCDPPTVQMACLAVNDNGEPVLARCKNFTSYYTEPQSETTQVWRILPETGQLYNINTNLCVTNSPDADGDPIAQVPTMQECDSNSDTQSWGFHPAGFVVSLAPDLPNDLCLVNEHYLFENIAEVVLSPCDYDEIGYYARYDSEVMFSFNDDDVVTHGTWGLRATPQ